MRNVTIAATQIAAAATAEIAAAAAEIAATDVLAKRRALIGQHEADSSK